MSDLYKNKYRISSARLKNWDYRWAGAYFITICTHNRHHYFGHINQQKMNLSSVGIIADLLWHEIKNHTTNVELGAFVVMPNHIHGILIINPPIVETLQNVETLHATSLSNKNKSKFMAQISPKSNSISTIIRSYKSAVTKHSKRLGFPFKWQSRFHDHIIRTEQSYNRITNYIINNPLKWKKDTFYA